MPDSSDKRKKKPSETQACPYCGKSIDIRNIKCPECFRNLLNEEATKKRACPYCGSSLEADFLKCTNCGKYIQKCCNHPRRQAKYKCGKCGKFICPECHVKIGHESYCSECFQDMSDEALKKEKSGTVISKPIQERNWFKRHLNWTAYLSSFITSTLVIITRLSWGLYPNYVALSIIFTLVSALIFILLWVWLLRSKKRSLWWLLLAFVNGILTYYAWWLILPNILLISYFFMSNKTLDVYQQPEDNMEPQP